MRYASTGGNSLENTHPFEQEGRFFAHNGHVGGLDTLERHLGADLRLVHGETDSERVFALITRETRARDGDVEAGIAAAVGWVAANLPLFALNFVLSTATDLWALRYPATHDLLILDRAAGGPTGARHLDAASPAGTVRVRAAALRDQRAVLVATEPMDEDTGWRALEPGELVHVDAEGRVGSSVPVDAPPAHPLRVEDLAPHQAASQGR